MIKIKDGCDGGGEKMTMIKKDEIDEILEGYNEKDITIATICSHTALQIFHGAREEGFKTLGVCKSELKGLYEKTFPLAKPDKFLFVDAYEKILDESFQEELIESNAIIIPHGSFVEYVGAKNIEEKLRVPMFGNRRVLEWESDRGKERKWLQNAGIKMPLEFKKPSDIDRLVMTKFPGAKGGQGYFLANSEEEFYEKLKERVSVNEKDCTIQEYIIGTRFYPHYFHSSLEKETELLSMDVRYESNIEGLLRVPPDIWNYLEPSFVVTGNTPVIARESLLPKIIKIGENVVKTSEKLFSPGLIGPFCVETICTEKLEFFAFEISARIVAGTNLYIRGSPYSHLRYKEPMSTGRRIAREIKEGIKKGLLERVIY